jgi:SCP-2 sterol transfer family
VIKRPFPLLKTILFLTNPVGKMMRVPLSLLSATIVTAVCIGAASAAAEGPSNTTPQGVFDGMRHSFQAEKAKGVHARYQWELSGPDGGQWWIDVDDGKCKMGKGKISNPNVTLLAKDKDWVAISNGQLARKLGEIFP